MLAADPPPDNLAWQELRGVLDEELRQLPPKYRTPLVLCYLEGMTNEEAARRLGWPAGSMSYRLARGRQLLRQRLRQRQQLLSGMVLLALLKRHAGPEEVPADLADSTLRGPGQVRRRHSAPAALAGHRLAHQRADDFREPVDAARRSALIPLLAILAAVALAGVLYFAITTGGGFSSWPGASEPPEPPQSPEPPASCH